MVMVKVNIFEAKAKLSEFLDRAAHGESIVICRHNKPVAELRAVAEARTEPRPIGPLPGRPTFEVPRSFFEPMSPEELDSWESGGRTDPLSPAWTPREAPGAARVAETRTTYARGRSRTRRRR